MKETAIFQSWVAEREPIANPGAVWEYLKTPRYGKKAGTRGGLETSRRVRPSQRKGGDSQFSTGTFRGN